MFALGVKPAGRDLVIEYGASNVAAHSAYISTLPTSYQSGPTMPVVNLQDPFSGAKFACYKDNGVLAGNPVTRGWGDVEGVGLQGGNPVHGAEIAMARYLADRGRSVAIITHSVGGAGASSYASGPQRTALLSHLATRLADLGEPFRLRAINARLFTGDTADEATAGAATANLTTNFADIVAACEAVLPGSAAGAIYLITEVHPWFVTNAGTWGPTAAAAYDAWLATPVAGHLKFEVPTQASVANANATGEDVADLGPTTLHPANPYIYSVGERTAKVIYRHALPIF